MNKMNKMIKAGKLLANILLFAFFLGLIALPISSVTLMSVQQQSHVLSAESKRNETTPQLPLTKENTQSSKSITNQKLSH